MGDAVSYSNAHLRLGPALFRDRIRQSSHQVSWIIPKRENHDDDDLFREHAVEHTERKGREQDASELALHLRKFGGILENARDGSVNLVAKPLANSWRCREIPLVGGVDVLRGFSNSRRSNRRSLESMLCFELRSNFGPWASLARIRFVTSPALPEHPALFVSNLEVG